VTNYCKAKGINASDIIKPQYIEKALNKYGFKDWDSMLAAVGHGGLKENQVVNKLNEEYLKDRRAHISDEDVLRETLEHKKEESQRQNGKNSSDTIIISGADNLSMRISKCCMPVPGDEIVGYITRGHGVTIHRTDCVNIVNLPEIERGRLIDAEWNMNAVSVENKFEVEVNIYANNRIGLIVDISKILTERGVGISSMNSRVGKQDRCTITLAFTVKSKDDLMPLVRKIRNVRWSY